MKKAFKLRGINSLSLKFDLKMKLTLLFLMVSLFQLQASESFGQKSKITLNMANVSIEDVLTKIESLTEFKFLYNDSELDYNNIVFINAEEEPLPSVLQRLFVNSNISYTLMDKQIILKNKKDTAKAFQNNESLLSIEQNFKISGHVVDQNDVPLPGANIIEKGTTRGTLTDFDGNFSFTVANKNSVIEISYIGFKTVEIKVGDHTKFNIKLEPGTSSLDEVVLIGYGSKKREEISSAVSTINSTQLADNTVGVTSFDRSLSGLAKGVNIKTTSGAPGAGVDINIRGYTSPFSGSDNNPLFVIDGVPIQTNPTTIYTDKTVYTEVQNPLLSINPNDIETIDILKDAAATAIYGSRGANGVIIVNTKKGKKNDMVNINLSTSITLSTPINTQDYLNTDEFKNYLDVYFANTFEAVNKGLVSPTILNNYRDMYNLNPDNTYAGLKQSFFGNADTDWNKAVYRNPAYSKNYNLSITGGSEKTSYYVSGGYTDQEGIVKNDTFDNYSLRFGLDTKLNKVFDMGINISLGYSDRFRGTAYDDFYDFVLHARPDIPVFDENGKPTRMPMVYGPGLVGTTANPYGQSTLHSNTTNAYNVIGNYYFKANIDDNFSVKASVNGSYMYTKSYKYTPYSLVGIELPAYGFTLTPSESYAFDSKSLITNLTTDLTANYSNKFDKHQVDALIGYSWLRNNIDKSYTDLTGFPDDYVLTNASNANLTSIDATAVESGLNSFLARASYNYDSKYFMTATMRMDKSSKFAPGNKEAFFPSLAASWNISKETFLEDSETINLLRLRASIGKTGSTNLGDFVFLQGFSAGIREEAFYNGNTAIGLGNQLANENAGWETTNEVNIGLDFKLFKNRFSGSIDLYNRKTTGALVNTPIPLEAGLSNFTSNFIDLTNKGFELEFGGDILKFDNLQWRASVNISKNINKIDRLTSAIGSNVNSPYETGKEINLIRGYVVEGIYQSQNEIDDLNTNSPTGIYSTIGTVGPGDYRYKDVNGDGELTIEDSYGIIGSSQPDFFGGFNSSISYKSFQLAAYFNFSYGSEIRVNDGTYLNGSPNFNPIQRYNVQHRWSPTNTGATLPQLVYRGSSDINMKTSTANVYDGSYLRLRNIQLTYNLSPEIARMLFIKRASVFVSGSNLFTWTNFMGMDPENGNGSASPNQLSGLQYPNSKAWSLGINFNF